MFASDSSCSGDVGEGGLGDKKCFCTYVSLRNVTDKIVAYSFIRKDLASLSDSILSSAHKCILPFGR